MQLVCRSCTATGCHQPLGRVVRTLSRRNPRTERVGPLPQNKAVFQVFGVNYDGLQGDDLAGVMERMQIEFPVCR